MFSCAGPGRAWRAVSRRCRRLPDGHFEDVRSPGANAAGLVPWEQAERTKPVYQAPRGTQDVLPERGGVLGLRGADRARFAALYGYGEIRTPTFEDTGLFLRGVGGGTDIVEKEMYSFQDKGGGHLTLRPEATASIVRAYLEHGMASRPQPVKLFTASSTASATTGRSGAATANFHQWDCEAIGEIDPLVDAEMVALLWRFYGGARAARADPAAEQYRRREVSAGLSRSAAGLLPAPGGRAVWRLPAASGDQSAALARLQGVHLPAGHRRGAAAARLAVRRVCRALRRPADLPGRDRHTVSDQPAPRPRPGLLHEDGLRGLARRGGRPVRARRRRALRRPGRSAGRPADARRSASPRASSASSST